MFENVNLDEIWYEGEDTKKYECGPLHDETIKKQKNN